MRITTKRQAQQIRAGIFAARRDWEASDGMSARASLTTKLADDTYRAVLKNLAREHEARQAVLARRENRRRAYASTSA